MKKTLLLWSGLFLTAPAQATWTYQELKDPITDKARGVASTEGIPAVTVKCDGEGKRQVYVQIHFPKYIGKGVRSVRPVQYRIDASEPATAEVYHNNNYVIFLNGPFGNLRDEIVRKIAAGSSLAIRLQTFDGEQYTSVIDISGSSEMIRKVTATCDDKTMPPL